MLLTTSVGVRPLGADVDHGRLAASHLVHHLVRHWLRGTFTFLRNHRDEVAERDNFLDLFEHLLILAVRNEDALDGCRLRRNQKLGDRAVILSRFWDFLFLVISRRIKDKGRRPLRESYDGIFGKFKSSRRSFAPNDQFAKVRTLCDLKEADSLII